MTQLRALEPAASEAKEDSHPARIVSTLAWTLCGVCVAAALVMLVLLPLNGYSLYQGMLMLAVVACAAMGALIVANQRGNTVGWLLLLGALGFGVGNAAIQYALYGLLTAPGALPWARAVAWLPIPVIQLGGWCLVVLLPLVFPTGRPLSPAWRRVTIATMALVCGLTVIASVLPGPVQGTPALLNPLGIAALLPWRDAIGFWMTWLMIALVCVAAAGLVVRYRRASGDERLQIKWLMFAVCAWMTLVLPSWLVETYSPRLFVVLDLLITLLFSGIPIAVGVAVLRYRLYDIELIINRTLVYGVLTLCAGGVYAVLVVGLGELLPTRDSHVVTLLATLVIAALFAPLRDRLQRRLNRLLYGDRYEPYVVLARLGQRLEATLAPDAVLPTIVQTVVETLRVPYAAIKLIPTATSRPLGAYTHDINVSYGSLPANLSPHQLASLPLSYQGETVGRLLLAPRMRNERLKDADWRLVRDLARQAGVAVHAVQLTTALQAGLIDVRRSRERLVTAQEEERRRIQRDLHDGLGPVLASMRMRLEACLDEAQTSAPALVEDLERLDALVGQATTDIRRLVHDLRPPALDQLGLVPALRQHVGRFGRETGIPVQMTTSVEHALPAAVDVTIFRITAEALTNVHKYARASHVALDLQRLGDALLLRISDNGVGGAVEGAYEGGGTGISSMRERAELLGGAMVLHSTPDAGTTIEVYLPLRDGSN